MVDAWWCPQRDAQFRQAGADPPADVFPASCRPPVNLSAGLFDHGLHLPSIGETVRCATYESNVLYTLRFMVDTKVGSGPLREARAWDEEGLGALWAHDCRLPNWGGCAFR
jgi:hypothetical protein